MKHPRLKSIISRNSLNRLLLVVAVMLMGLSWGCSTGNDGAPHAKGGVIDLSAVDLRTSGPVKLEGEWEFYWKQLLTPADFRTTPAPQRFSYLALPTAWNDVLLKGEKLGGAGYATLRLKILPGQGRQELTLRLADINSAYKLWADGRLLVSSGRVGTTADREIPAQAIQLPRLSTDNQPVELVLQLSNHHFREGGVVTPITLGLPDIQETAQRRQWGLVLLCIGSLLVMGIYHIVLFCFRRQDSAPLYFGIYCLLWMANSLTSNSSGWVVHLFADAIPAQFMNRIDQICFVMSIPVGYRFFRALYPLEFSPRLQHLAWVLASLFTGMGLALPFMIFTSAIPLYYAFSIFMILYSSVKLFTAVRRKREGAAFILLGFCVLGLAGINDMLYDLQLIRSLYLIHIGMFVFILFQAFALSLRFSKAFSAVEQLSRQLTDKNLALEHEMAERNRLEREIVTVSEDERRRISHDLHDGLCQQLTGARLFFSALERKLAGTGQQQPELSQLSSLLEESVNHAYDLSRGLWPVEHAPHRVSPSLEALVRRLGESSGIALEFNQERACDCCSNSNVTQLFRIAQEAITNAVKHARPHRIVVGLHCAGRKTVVLTVHDDGIGRSRAAGTDGGLGMDIMSHRARIIGGTLTINDGDGGGTLVTCIVPCETGLMEETTE